MKSKKAWSINDYNNSENVIVISSYPERGLKYSGKVCAVGGFAKNTIENLKKYNSSTKFVVITTAIKKKQAYIEDNDLVLRTVLRNKLTSIFPTGFLLFRLNRIKNVIVEYEFGSFGGVIINSLFLILFLLNKILGKKQFIVLHQVISDLDTLRGHLGWKKSDYRLSLFNLFLKYFYEILYFVSSKIIVTEDIFKYRLRKIIGKDSKVEIVPHGVDTTFEMVGKKKSRKTLGLPQNKFVILYFGYITWYKGADLFLKFAQSNKNRNFLFVLAGGKSFTNANKQHYLEYFDQFNTTSNNFRITGFVPEDQINLYFQAADLVVLPYRTMMSSSGPLSLSFSFEKPVLLSHNLTGYLTSPDFSEGLKIAGLESNDVFFKLNIGDFESKIKSYNKNKLIKFSRLMKKQRAYIRVAKHLDMVLHNKYGFSPRLSSSLLASNPVRT